MGSLSLYGLAALPLHLLVTLFKDHLHKRETHRQRRSLIPFVHRLTHNEEEKKNRRTVQVVNPYQYMTLNS